MKRNFLTLTLGLVLVFVIVGCSTASPTATPLPPAAPTATPQPQEQLIAGAQKEGAFKLYTSLNEAEAKPLLEKFTQKYPFIKADFFRASSADLVQRVLTETKSLMPSPDVIELDSNEVLKLYNEKLLAAYKSPEAATYPDGAKHPWGYYTTCYINAIVIAYNTKLVKPQEAPKTLDDLLDPKWAGKIGIEPEDWALMPFTAKVMGDGPANTFWKKLSEQKPKVINGHTEVANAVAAGQVALSPTTYAHRIEALKKKGESIEWVNTDPVYANLSSLVVTVNAPHPNSARLFVDWLLSAEGQGVLADAGRIPIRPGIKANPARLTEGVRFYYGDPTLISEPNQVRNQYRKLLGLQ